MAPERGPFYGAVAVQFAVLLYMIARSQTILDTGREVRLRTMPVDPRSLISGDYVILRYPISRLAIRDDDPSYVGSRDVTPGQLLFVKLRIDPSGLAELDAVTTFAPSEGELFLRGKVQRVEPDGRGGLVAEVQYGIESWYVPEGKGRDIERRRGELVVVIAVAEDGRAALKRLEL